MSYGLICIITAKESMKKLQLVKSLKLTFSGHILLLSRFFKYLTLLLIIQTSLCTMYWIMSWYFQNLGTFLCRNNTQFVMDVEGTQRLLVLANKMMSLALSFVIAVLKKNFFVCMYNFLSKYFKSISTKKLANYCKL